MTLKFEHWLVKYKSFAHFRCGLYQMRVAQGQLIFKDFEVKSWSS
jgi:hypothetical protein